VLRLTDRNRPWWALIGFCIGLFLLMLDSTVVALALPQSSTTSTPRRRRFSGS
jgi:hypothetical protein